MMITKNCLIIAAVGATMTVLSVSAQAIDNANSIKPVAPMKMAPTKLSSGECKGLGGQVIAVSDCKGFDACITTDKDGVIHKACLTKQ